MNLFLSGANAQALATPLALALQRDALPHTPRTWRLELGQRHSEVSALLEDMARTALTLQVDWALLSPDQTWEAYRTLASDMDSTLITIECIDELADLYGKKVEVAAITEAAMRGEITDFADSLRRRVELLRGLSVGALDTVYTERLRLTPGAEALIDAARQHGLSTLLVSGGFTDFTERLKERLALSDARANQLERAGGSLTGQVTPPILDSVGKRDALADHCAQRGWTAREAIAIGDGANDLPMLKSAGLSVAFHAKPAVAAAADIAIRHGGLDLLDDWLRGVTQPT